MDYIISSLSNGHYVTVADYSYEPYKFIFILPVMRSNTFCFLPIQR